MNQPHEHRCVECRCGIRQGEDALLTQRGVAGPRGFVPVEDAVLLCCEECADAYFSGDDAVPIKRRIA